MPADAEYQLKQKIEALQTEVKSLSNLLYAALKSARLDRDYDWPPRCSVWWRVNSEKIAAQRVDEERMEQAERIRKEREYERLRRELGKEN